MNQVTLIGFVGKDAETRTTPGGNQVTKFSLATNDGYKNASGEWVDNSNWHYVIAWDHLSNNIASKIKKGWKVLVSGKIETRIWEREDGIKVNVVEIKAFKIEQLVHMPKESAQSSFPEPKKGSVPMNQDDDLDDDMPF